MCKSNQIKSNQIKSNQIKSNSIILLFSLILGLSFTSCNNFFKAGEVKDEIEQHIAYANASSYLIKVTFQEGTGSIAKPASGETLKKVTDTFDIRFEPLPDFAFICWQVTSTKLLEGQNINDYVEIEDIQKAETRVTFKKALEDIVITARVAERAQIISYSPMTSEVLKDSSVLVQFDHDMNEDSIYYTKDDIDALKQSLGEENISFLPSKKTQGRFYGYKKLATDNITEEYFFKNISFVDNETNENLTSHYDEPYFATPKMLTINTNKDIPIGDYTPILVTIDKNFFYTFDDGTEKGKDVLMTGSKKWTYQVNDQVDDAPPKFLDPKDIKIAMNAGLTDKSEISVTNVQPVVSLNTLFNRDKKINLNIKVTDTGSGPLDEFTVYLRKIQNEKYENISNPVTRSVDIQYQRVTSQKGIINKDIDLSTLFEKEFSDEKTKELSDGVYQMSFDFWDRSGKHLKYPENGGYYFIVDNTPPDVPIPTLSSTNNTTYTLSWDKNDIADYKEAIVTDGAGYTSAVLPNDTNSINLTIDSTKTYEVKVTFRDFAGNEVEETVPKFLTDLKLTGTPNFTGDNASQIEGVFLEDDYLSNYGLSLITYWSDGTTEDSTFGYRIQSVTSHKTKANLSYSYSYGGVTKSITSPSKYYFAKSDAITNSPVKLENYAGTSNNGTYYKFGDFPKTIASNQNSNNYTSNKVYNDWYLGNDGYFYEKCLEQAYYSDYKYSDGTTPKSKSNNTNNTEKYFKVEPINWRVLTENYQNTGNVLLFAENALTANVPFYGGTEERTLRGATIYINNYKYSNIRAFLNSTKNQFVIDGGGTTDAYNADWSGKGKGFLHKAFTTKSQGLIMTTTVDNSRSTVTNGGYNVPNTYNSFFCDNTNDTIFLLSYDEVRSFTQITGGNYGERERVQTDYAIANYAKVEGSFSNNTSHHISYGLRSPGNSEERNCYVESDTGFTMSTTAPYYAVVPALCIKSEKLPQ